MDERENSADITGAVVLDRTSVLGYNICSEKWKDVFLLPLRITQKIVLKVYYNREEILTNLNLISITKLC
jgi:hypothetical protein